MKSQIFIQLHIAFFAQILHNLNLKQQISILFPGHLRGDQRAQQKVFTPSDWINLGSNLEKKTESTRGALRALHRRGGLLNDLEPPGRFQVSENTDCRTCQTPEVSVSNTYLDHDSSILFQKAPADSRCWSVQSRLLGPSNQYFIEELPDKWVLGFIISLLRAQPSCVPVTRDSKHLWHLDSLV